MTLPYLRFVLVAALLGGAVCPGQCAAGIVAYSNLGPPVVVSGSIVGAYGGGFYGPAELKVAQRFTPTTSGQLNKLELLLDFAVERYDGHTPNVDELTLTIVADENGQPGGAGLWTQLFVDQAFPFTGAPDGSSISSFEVNGGLALQKGTHYWLTATTTSIGDTPYTWWTAEGVSNEPRAHYWIRGNSPDFLGRWLVNSQPEYGVNEFGLRVTVIPEPAAAALMLAASATLLAVRRRRTP